MDISSKKKAFLFMILLAGSILVVTGATSKIHFFSGQAGAALVENYAKDKSSMLFESLGYTGEILVISIFFFTRYPGIVFSWLLRISYDLTFGANSSVNVFVIAKELNWIIAVCCILLSIYSVHLQNEKISRLMEKKGINTKDDLARFL